MTMAETAFVLVVITVAIGAALRSISSFVVLSDGAWERSLAIDAAEATLERMRTEDFDQLFVRYDAEPADDPPGAPGPGFDVVGLDPQPGDPDGRVGHILFPVEAAAPGVLREDRVDPDFALPRDLDADDVIDGVDHSGDYELLPVRILIQWRGRSGNRSYEVETVLRRG